MQDIPVSILQRFDEIYQKLATEMGMVLMPARDEVMGCVNRCSFRMFDESEEFMESARAKSHTHLVSPTFGRAFRVYFNSYSRKVYVDLNREPMAAVSMSLETEDLVLSDLIRSIVLADPGL